MKRTVAFVLVVVCALLTTSFVLSADKKSQTQQNSPRLVDVDLEITASTGGYYGFFEVVFRNPTTNEEYYFYVSGGDWTHGGIPEGVYEVRLNTLSPTSYQYEMNACAQKVISNGPVTANVCVGYPGAYQFYITNSVN